MNPNEGAYFAQKNYAVDPAPESAFDRLGSFVKVMQELDARAFAIADRLSGPIPTQSGSTAEKMGVGGGGGLIDGLLRDTAAIRGLADRVFESLNRIESRLESRL